MDGARNRMVVLRSRPVGLPRPEDFELIERPLPALRPGEALIRNAWLGMAPSARLRMDEAASYAAPMALGDVVHGQSVGTVVESRRDGFEPGDAVVLMHSGWQDYTVASAASLYAIDLRLAPWTAWLGLLGSSGQTAWIGLTDIGGVRDGETVVVSAAAGAVGALAAEYNSGFGPGPEWSSFLAKRLTVRGFIMSDHAARRPDFVAEMAAWHRAGSVRLLEDRSDGLEQAPRAFIRMLKGETLGKTLVRLA